MEKYQYTLNDLIVKPHKYTYTEFEGDSFLDKWKNDRAKFYDHTPSQDIPASNHDLNSEEISRIIETGEVQASDMLLCLHDELSSESPLPSTYDLVVKVVKRFEIFKRIHSDYKQGFKAVEKKNYHDSQNYIYTAFLFEKAYCKTNKLYYLNAFIKVVDTLSSIAPKLNEQQCCNVSWLVGQEAKHIEDLTVKIRSLKEET
jgi:hypothetical protein